MFDLGFWEVALILVIALIVIGPERLPQVARTVGNWVGRARRYIEGVKSEVEKEFDTAELKRILHNQEVQIRELQGKLSRPQDLLDQNSANTETNKIEPPAENQYEIIEEKDFHTQQLTEEHTAEVPPSTDSQSPSSTPEQDKPA